MAKYEYIMWQRARYRIWSDKDVLDDNYGVHCPKCGEVHTEIKAQSAQFGFLEHIVNNLFRCEGCKHRFAARTVLLAKKWSVKRLMKALANEK